jgi:two-component system, response regulator RegA
MTVGMDPGTNMRELEPEGRYLLLEEPEERLARALTALLHRDGWQVVRSDSGAVPDPSRPFHAVVMPLTEGNFPNLDGVRRARAQHQDAKLIVTLTRPSTRVIVECLRVGADDCIVKPFAPTELVQMIARAGPCEESPVQAAQMPSLARIEWEYIQRVLVSHDGNISKSARTLGIRRTTLQRKLKKNPPAY